MRLNDDQLKDIAARFEAEMKKGLSAASNVAAAVKMLPTYVHCTPDGTGDSLKTLYVWRSSVMCVFSETFECTTLHFICRFYFAEWALDLVHSSKNQPQMY